MIYLIAFIASAGMIFQDGYSEPAPKQDPVIAQQIESLDRSISSIKQVNVKLIKKLEDSE